MSDHDSNEREGRTLSPETLAAQALGRVDAVTRALVPAIHPSTTYERDADGGYSSGRGYTRPHNPTYDEPEELLAALEAGDDCLLFASGMAAATAVFQSLLPGDHVVVSRVMYWALRTWLVDFAVSWGLEVEFVDTCDIDAVAAFGPRDVERLLGDAGIVRHRGKIVSAVNNACRASEAIDEFGSLAAYIWSWEPQDSPDPPTGKEALPASTPESVALARDLKRRGWSFLGPTTVYAFMQSMGLVNDHIAGCFARAECEAERAALTRPRS